jgi:hypothetical protein
MLIRPLPTWQTVGVARQYVDYLDFNTTVARYIRTLHVPHGSNA